MTSTTKYTPLHHVEDPRPPSLNGPFSKPTTYLNWIRICSPTRCYFPMTSTVSLHTFILPQTQANEMRNVTPAIWIQSIGVKILSFVALVDSPTHGPRIPELRPRPPTKPLTFLPSSLLLPYARTIGIVFKMSPRQPLLYIQKLITPPRTPLFSFYMIFFSKDLENVRSYLEKSPLTMTFNLTLHLACQFQPLLWSGPYKNLTSKAESFQFLEEKKNKTEQPIWQK